jgi:hypothetical protein
MKISVSNAILPAVLQQVDKGSRKIKIHSKWKRTIHEVANSNVAQSYSDIFEGHSGANSRSLLSLQIKAMFEAQSVRRNMTDVSDRLTRSLGFSSLKI